MIIQRSEIKRFRGFEDVELDLGSQITVIAGQNGTQKTTILGILTQPFTITDSANPMLKVKPLSGGNFKSAFGEKFKLSEKFDKPKEHEWTLHLNQLEEPFIVESIPRGTNVRFWKKGDRSAGSGYIQLPVIYLSLQRLLPIGEDDKLKESKSQKLNPQDIDFFQKWHKKILISLDNIQGSNFLESPSKTTVGINTNHYDWCQNSAGQDNIGKILLAVLSFKRLMEDFPNDYKGGILAIDELDATLYPASQLELLLALRTFAAKFKIQIIFTTHSLTILEKACGLQEENIQKPATKDQIKVVFLEKRNAKVKILQDVSYNSIVHKLNVTVAKKAIKKLLVYCEDKETEIFAKGILKGKATSLKFFEGTFSCALLISLVQQKIPAFEFPQGLVIVDGDVRTDSSSMRKVRKLNNIILLPGKVSPERALAKYLYELDDNSPIWTKIDTNYSKQFCFKGYDLDEIDADRVKAKEWFNNQLEYWGHNGYKVIDPWMQANSDIVDKFIDEYSETYNKFAVFNDLEQVS